MRPEVPRAALQDDDEEWAGCTEFFGIYASQEEQAPTQNGNHGMGLTSQTTFSLGFWFKSMADRGSGMRTKTNIWI